MNSEEEQEREREEQEYENGENIIKTSNVVVAQVDHIARNSVVEGSQFIDFESGLVGVGLY